MAIRRSDTGGDRRQQRIVKILTVDLVLMVGLPLAGFGTNELDPADRRYEELSHELVSP